MLIFRGDFEARKGPAVIPMVVEKDWRIVRLLEMEKEGKLTDEDRAKLALLTEAQPFQPDVSFSLVFFLSNRKEISLVCEF